MLNKRFSNGLVVEIDVPAKYTGHYVIPVALQMLLENAIKHNIVSAAHPLNVKIFVLHEGYLTVRNNLQVKQQSESSTQIGLNNISQRYQLVNGSNIIVNKTDREFEISIPLLQVN
ncbi:MAG: hypothetical protein EOO02_16870 [Chitinophagaceae bacterium]|nr:MAG: hypothetical protein EOO02_16870 [Chitinophagaceae bacterium]